MRLPRPRSIGKRHLGGARSRRGRRLLGWLAAASLLTHGWLPIVLQAGRTDKRVVRFYNRRGTAEQHIKEGKNAIRWTRLSCHAFRHKTVWLHLHALAYNLANSCAPWPCRRRSSIGRSRLCARSRSKSAPGSRHGRYVVFQVAGEAVPRALFAEIPRRIDQLRPKRPPAPA
jgi:hypothetical protein